LIFLVFWSCSDFGEQILGGCGGSAVEDCAGVCGGDSVLSGCANVCNSIAVDDACGTCDGSISDATQCDCPISGEVRDCAGVCGGDSVLSGCDNACNSTAVEDCASVCGGSSVIDDCSVCGGDNSTCVNFSTEIKPLFSSCTGCHGGSGGLSLSTYTSLMIGGNSGAVVTPGDGSGSLLVKKLRGTASGSQMPKNGPPYLDPATINLIETWIDEGALDN